ncbi:MAG: DUF2334 domain-containing protein [candidate division WOR-3 bacterium]
MSNFFLKKVFIIILFFSILIQVFLINTSNNNKKINLVFRMDDYSDNSNIRVEEKVFETFSKLSIPLIVGVVPFTMDENNRIEPINQKKISLISEYKNVDFFTFALHGHTHKNNSFDRRFKYEFNYLPLDTQIKMLNEGKIFLESITERKIQIFIPPWNGYDSNTIIAMEKTGFKTISAGIRGFSINSDIKYLPLTTTIKEVKEIFQKNFNVRLKNVMIVVNIHSYEFEKLEDIKNMEQLLNDLSCNKKIEFLSYGSNILLDSKSLNLNKKFQYLLSLIPEFWASFSGYHSFYLITENNINFYEKFRFVLTIVNYVFFVFLVSSLIPLHFSDKFLNFRYLKILLFFVFFTFFIFAVVIFSNLRINSRGITILTSLSGSLFSIIFIMKTKR